ncbi:MAG TPA: metalloregulator ArsR/SmtB family transcription factor [Phototrophicaceae bacterium]|nr:metalloregulator ArsR/SmtB family transcription factor [Phototrophicaceae bacterium]
MMENWTDKHLLDTLKALADESRLSLLRLVNERERTVGDLADQVQLGEPTVSHHLTRLREVGLVTLRMAGNQRFYRSNPQGLAAFKRMVSTVEQIPFTPEAKTVDNGWIDELGWDEEDLQVLRDYTENKKLTTVPSKQKKMLVILRWLATFFEADRLYTEPEVNAILRGLYEHDFVSLRRDLVDFGYLRRERGGGKYWLAPTDESAE